MFNLWQKSRELLSSEKKAEPSDSSNVKDGLVKRESDSPSLKRPRSPSTSRDGGLKSERDEPKRKRQKSTSLSVALLNSSIQDFLTDGIKPDSEAAKVFEFAMKEDSKWFDGRVGDVR